MNLDTRTKKTIEEGIDTYTIWRGGQAIYISYSPGNGTRYRLLFSKLDGLNLQELDTTAPQDGWLVTNLNSMNSMIVVDNKSMLYFEYVQKKLNCGIADAVCIAEIIGHCTGRTFYTCEEVAEM